MGWKEARSRYTTLSTLSEQKVEDLVARRVLRGLGLTEKLIWDAERAVFGQVKDDQALWVRTKELLKAVWHSEAKGLKLNIEVCWVKPDYKDVLERMAEIEEQDLASTIFMTRTKGAEQSITFVNMRDMDMIDLLTPPYNVLRKKAQQEDNTLTITQETEHFIAQFGPYTWLQQQMRT